MTIDKRIEGHLPKPECDITAKVAAAILNLPAQEQAIAKSRDIALLIAAQAQEHYGGWECRIHSENNGRCRFTINDPQGNSNWWAEFTRSTNGEYFMKTANSSSSGYRASQVFEVVSHEYESRLKEGVDSLIKAAIRQFVAGLTIEDLWSYIASTS